MFLYPCFIRVHPWLVSCLLVAAITSGAAQADDARTPAGLRVFYTGHSFHMFVPPQVDQLVKAAGIQGHKLAGRQGIGGSRVIQHWELPDDKNTAKPALSGGQIDVFTMAAHVAIPDDGITHFTNLGLKQNPNLRLLVQASWFPYDVPDLEKRIRDNAKRDDAQIPDLQAAVNDWRKKLEAQVDDLNRQHGKRSVFIVPVGDAVVQLRALVMDGKYPGITKQSELFRDPIGHGGPHIQWLASYCNFAAIYRTSPQGLKLTVEGLDAAQHAILQKIAWETVSAYSHAGLEPESQPLQLLFLGDNGHHQPAARFKQLQPVLKERGIELTYSDKLEDLNSETLGKYAGLIIYANTTRISPEQEQALLDYVASGKGFIPLHCASYCFLNSPKYIDLVGAQFQRHGTGTFRTILAEAEHPILRGFAGFESWDETYVHTKHNETNRTILEYRQEGDRKEPWTWVRAHGKGRVFYTAWGHDQRTWGNPGFQNLVERGIRWAIGTDPAVVPGFTVGQAASLPASSLPVQPSAFAAAEPPAPQTTPKRTDIKPFDFSEANIPFYPAGQRWGTVTSGPRKMQQPLTVEESMKHFVTPVGFEVKLFVAEPELEGKPIFMTWDDRGRLWVCETYDYPNELQPLGEGRDRIRICEDTDADGRADKFTVFAEKLSIPTTIAFYRGGAIVQNGTETIYLKDTNGDDKADLKKTLVTGWSMRDTHGEVSNFRYGLDNWYWAMQGYNDSQPVLTNGKPGPRFRQGFFRFKVEGENENVAVTDLEFLRSTNNNTWGLGISEEGIVFGSTANGNPSEHMPIPNRYYEAVLGWSSTGLTGIAETNRFYPITENVRQVDWHGGFTAAAGHALYTARNYPREYWNRTAFVTEPTGHLIATFVLRQQGAGFRSKNSWNIVASDDEWSSPIQAEVGPDGNVWFIDWYNYIVQHNPTPAGFRTGKGAAYETPLRDKKHGRIYRLVYRREGEAPAELNPKSKIQNPKSAADLLAALKSDVMLNRLTAQRLLIERGEKNIVPALTELTKDQTVDAIGLNTPAIHALSTLSGLGALNTNVAAAALRHPSAGVRRTAAQLLPQANESLSGLLNSGALNDPEIQVRLQATLALTKFKPHADAAAAAVKALADTTIQADRILLDAVTAAAAGQDQLFLAAVAASREKSLANQPAVERIAIVAEHLARGDSAEPRPLVAALEQAQPEVASAILRGLARGWPRDRKPSLTPEIERSLAALFEKLPPAAKSQVAALATRWGSTKLGDQIAQMAGGLFVTASKSDASDADRVAAAVQFVDLQKNDSAAAKLLDLITPRSSPELSAGLVDALARSESPAIGAALSDQLPKLTPTVRQTALRVLLSRSDWTTALLNAIQQDKLQLADLSLDQKQALANHPDRQITNRARRLLEAGGILPNPDRQTVLDSLHSLTEQKGDATAGKLVFKNQCAKCHVHAGEGTKIGPDLTGMAVHPKHELLVHLIDPSRSVEGNYRVYSVLTDEGQTISGLLASETKTSIELIDTEAKRHVVLRENIDNLQASPKSLMPEGFEKQVKPEEIRDLLEYLTLRGQYVPIPLEKFATAVTTRGLFYSEDSAQERFIFDDWSPKTAEGVPFVLVDPQGSKNPNAILLYGPEGKLPPTMPRSVSLPCSFPAKAVHLLSGVAGWAYPYGGDSAKGSHTMTVRLHYADGQTEDHKLNNGEHFADYIRRVDVPQSKFAFNLRGRQLRYLSVPVERAEPLTKIELLKGTDRTAPLIMALTVETR